MATTISFKYRGQTVEARIWDNTGTWDGFQTVTTKDEQGNERGRGDFDVDGKRIFAENYQVAKMIRRRMA